MKFTKYAILALVAMLALSATPAFAKGHKAKHKAKPHYKFNTGSMATGSPKARTLH